jgi:16S rRNA (adenine1518-N6/adenine1519-N6)-dimethyltransferase
MDWSRSAVVRLLRERGIRTKRRLGQNFLLDGNYLDAIVRAAEVAATDGVVEIGSGIGNLTARLAEAAGHVWAFEIDPQMHALTAELLSARKNVTLVAGDGAAFEERVEAGRWRRLKVVSNLPYSDFHRILLRLLGTRLEVERHVLMLQREAFERLRSGPGEDGYGPLAVLVGGFCDVKFLRRAGPKLFHPEPRVESVLFELRRRSAPENLERLERALVELFRHRRKTLGAVWKRLTGGAIDSRERVEQLAPERLLELAAKLSAAK